MTPEEAIEYFKTYEKAAGAMGLSRPSMSYYVRKGGLPYTKQCELEKATSGKLKARREDDPENPFYKPKSAA
ncbi:MULTISPECIES: Cro/CI family transcriptional regulator [Neptunomonas]|uniref:DNA-binding protein n=1 Tax=Neptunomonas marina TaxID=1815562 RepID=A0A437QE30_9GAMM|nr:MULTISPECIES: Cro/CI family transcriptional regulator [Neptunomonas]RVU32689.1 hypothetical protein EOE65_03275 [Neptunomonas marina]